MPLSEGTRSLVCDFISDLDAQFYGDNFRCSYDDWKAMKDVLDELKATWKNVKEMKHPVRPLDELAIILFVAKFKLNEMLSKDSSAESPEEEELDE